jgi:hypothetical protein
MTGTVGHGQRPGDEVVVTQVSVDAPPGGAVDRLEEQRGTALGALGHLQLDDVDEVQRHHLGVEEVVAVVPDARDPQAEREFGRRLQDDLGGHGRHRTPA